MPGTVRAVATSSNVAIAAVANAIYAVAFDTITPVKIHAFAQSSQVHASILLHLESAVINSSLSTFFLASGRECAVVELEQSNRLGLPKTASTPSPIVSAVLSHNIIALLQTDGLVSLRSPLCLGVSLKTVEVGNRPNDFCSLLTANNDFILALSRSGACRKLTIPPDTRQDLADRLFRLTMDAFGATGFPRNELTAATRPSFPAANYHGEAVTSHAKIVLKEYLEALLGFTDAPGFTYGGSAQKLRLWPLMMPSQAESNKNSELGKNDAIAQGAFSTATTSGRGEWAVQDDFILTTAAMLCWVCSQLDSDAVSLARRAAQHAATNGRNCSGETIALCSVVVDRLLREASSKISLISNTTNQARHNMTPSTDLIEAAVWLLRACGKHEQAITVTYDRLRETNAWSPIKYDSYTATHLSELWSMDPAAVQLVMSSPATHRLLENNPRLGLSVFTALHPHNETQWMADTLVDPLAKWEKVYDVVKLLKSIKPYIPFDKEKPTVKEDMGSLPLESGRALAVAFLRSAIGISTGRPLANNDSSMGEEFDRHEANFHDELSFLLLEGIIAERPEHEDTKDNELGSMYRALLREFLKWPLAKLRTERFMASLPPSFLQEKALVLGRVGRHEDALRILYTDLNSLELALEYCDDRFSLQKIQQAKKLINESTVSLSYNSTVTEDQIAGGDNAYLPLVRVALDSCDSSKGTDAAVKVLALRRHAVDHAAALRMLPPDIPLSQVARPFLIPALVDGESQVRRMTIVSALLKLRYLRLKEKLTESQLKAQSSIHVVPALKPLNLGDLLHSTKPFKARTTSTNPGQTMPFVEIIKHFFPRHLVIQAKVTNVPYASGGASSVFTPESMDSLNVLADVAFVVAESSEVEAIQPLLQVPIQILPSKLTGSAWCVLSAVPSAMDGPTAQLTCELRYAVEASDAQGLVKSPNANLSRTFVEELQDLEVHAAHFS